MSDLILTLRPRFNPWGDDRVARGLISAAYGDVDPAVIDAVIGLKRPPETLDFSGMRKAIEAGEMGLSELLERMMVCSRAMERLDGRPKHWKRFIFVRAADECACLLRRIPHQCEVASLITIIESVRGEVLKDAEAADPRTRTWARLAGKHYKANVATVIESFVIEAAPAWRKAFKECRSESAMRKAMGRYNRESGLRLPKGRAPSSSPFA